MNEQQFDRYLSTKVKEGQHRLATMMKRMVHRASPTLAASLSDEGDDPFLEPTLFAKEQFIALYLAQRDLILALHLQPARHL